MDKLIDKLIDKGLRMLMDENRDALARTDKIYLKDREDADQLERQYNELYLTNEQRMLIDDYMACTSTASHRFADISYMCGIKDTVRMLVSLGLIKGIETEE